MRRMAEKLRSAVTEATGRVSATRKQHKMSGNAAGTPESVLNTSVADIGRLVDPEPSVFLATSH